MKPLAAFLVTALGVLVAVGIVIRIFGVGDSEGGGTAPIVTPLPTPHPDAITISMASSITKWEWLDAAVEDFNAASGSTPNLQVQGKPIHVEVLLVEDPLTGKLRHWNSPSQVDATVRGEIEPTILSPAATTWILKLNKEWRALYGKEISSGPWTPLLSTPVVIAMWESRARALGCWPAPGPDCT